MSDRGSIPPSSSDRYKKYYSETISSQSGRKQPGRRTNKKLWIIIAGILVIAGIVVFLILGPLKDRDSKQTDGTGTAGTMDTADTEPLVSDLDAYFSERGTLVRKIPVSDSPDVRTEAEEVAVMQNRGFNQYPVTSEYTMSGNYSQAAEVAGGDTKHPIYTTYYVSSAGDAWNITDVNGTIVAYPITYNLNAEMNAQLAITETDSIMSYDSGTGLFYETIPNTPEVILKKVERIDADLLEKLDAKGIDSL